MLHDAGGLGVKSDCLGGRLAGGLGGKAGSHGSAGQGGPGGDGGKPLEYTVKHVNTTFADKHMRETSTEVESIIMRGGRPGPRGRDGMIPSTALVPGEAGNDGSLTIKVAARSGATEEYSGSYDLVLSSIEEKTLSSMYPHDGIPTFEFGETVLVPSVTISNIGEMPAPGKRVLVSIGADSKNVKVNPTDRLFLPPTSRLPASASGRADQGHLRYTTAKPCHETLGDDFEPVAMRATRRFKAYQLGPETKPTILDPPSEFMREYKNFDSTAGSEIRLAYPLENRDGIVGVRQLAVGESTPLILNLVNTSGQGLGAQSDSKRKIYIQYYLGEDGENDVGVGDVKFFKGRPIPNARKIRKKSAILDPSKLNKNGLKGHTVRIGDLKPGSQMEVVHTLKLGRNVKPMSRAAVQVDIYLQDLPQLLPNGKKKKTTTLSLIQRRKFVVSCQPSFRHSTNSKAVLVTSSATTKEQCHAWLTLLNDLLGLKPEIFSLSVYGRLDPALDVAYNVRSGTKTKKLRELFAGKLVVLLNDKFRPSPKEAELRPSRLLVRLADFHPSTRWLVVGGSSGTSGASDLRHLSPIESSIRRRTKVRQTEEPSSEGTERTCDPTETDFSSRDSLVVEKLELDGSPGKVSENDDRKKRLRKKMAAENQGPKLEVTAEKENEARLTLVEAQTAVPSSQSVNEPEHAQGTNSVDGTTSAATVKQVGVESETQQQVVLELINPLSVFSQTMTSDRPAKATETRTSRSESPMSEHEDLNQRDLGVLVSTYSGDIASVLLFEEGSSDSEDLEVNHESIHTASVARFPSAPRSRGVGKQPSDASTVTAVSSNVAGLRRLSSHAEPKESKSEAFTVTTSATDSDASVSPILPKAHSETSAMKVSKPTLPAKSHQTHSPSHESLRSFEDWVVEALAEERAKGTCKALKPGLNVITVQTKLVTAPDQMKAEHLLQKQAIELQHWLQKHDPVRFYVVEINVAPRPVKANDGVVCLWTLGTLLVHRGITRDRNTLLSVVSDVESSLQSPASIASSTIAYSVASALEPKIKVKCYTNVLRQEETDPPRLSKISRALRDSLVVSFINDAAHLYDAKIEYNSLNNKPWGATLQSLLDSPDLAELMADAKVADAVYDDKLRQRLEVALSDLFARLEAVADSKDLQPWWSPLSRKFATRKMLLDSVRLLREAWSPYLNEKFVRETRHELDIGVTSFLRKGRGKLFVRSRGRWRGGLRHIHTPNEGGPLHIWRQSEWINQSSGKIKKLLPVTMTKIKVKEIQTNYRNCRELAGKVGAAVKNERSVLVA